MTNAKQNVNDVEDFDEFDAPNPDAKRRGGAGMFQRIVFVNAHPDYDGTSISGGGFMIVKNDGVTVPEGWGEEITLKDGKGALVSPSLECVVIGSSAQTRRFIVEIQDGDKVVPADHIDIESKFFRENIQQAGGAVANDFLDSKGKGPKSRVSLFVVMKADPSRVWELGLKSGNANVVRSINDQLIELADMQTRRLGDERGKPYANTLMPFINWVTLTAGCRLAYSSRTQGEDAGGFSRLSLAWWGVQNLKRWQREFVKSDQFGEKIDQWAEWHAAKKLVDYNCLHTMYTGLGNYKRFVEMREELDKALMAGYIKPLVSFEEIDKAIEEKRRRYFERSIAINTNQLPPAPVDNTPRNRDEWEERKQDIAQSKSAAPAKPAQGVPEPQTLWSLDTLQQRKKMVILKWADASDEDKAAIVSSVNIQYLMRVGDPFDFGAEPTAKSVAKAISTCITWDEVKAEEVGEVTY